MVIHDNGREAEFEQLLAGIFRRAGWRVVRQPRQQPGDMRPDLVVDAGNKKYVVELKSSAEGRGDRLVPLMSQAILQAQAVARQFPGPAVPVAVVAAPHIPDSVAGHVKEFAGHYAEGVAIGVIDSQGMCDFSGYGLEKLNSERAASRQAKMPMHPPPPLNLFSDLNQWMLKILLAANIPEALLFAPRGRYKNATQLAQAAGVSLMSAFRLIRQLSVGGFLEESREGFRMVRVEELMQRWAAAQQEREIPARWIIPGGKNQLSIAVRSYLSQSEEGPSPTRKSRASRFLGTNPGVCIGLFAAAEFLGFGFVQGVAPHIYLQRPDPKALRQLGLSVEDAERRPDIYVRIPRNGEAIFRASVRRDGLPVSDILQVWLDVSNHPVRGKEQAAQIWRRVLAPCFQKGGK
jgi:hypothetical protein